MNYNVSLSGEQHNGKGVAISSRILFITEQKKSRYKSYRDHH